MSELVLHHYPLSPFSEKIRAMLGYTGLQWCSVITSEMPPRPLLAPLAGGYRKIPVAQIGADVFGDTRTITQQIAMLSGRPLLSLEGVDDEIRAFVKEADLTLFLACILSSTSLKLNIKLFRSFSLLSLFRFFRDRIQIGRTSSVPRMGLGEARRRVREHLADMEARLARRQWLFADEPCIADFSAYHGLWFLTDVAESSLVKDYPAVEQWMQRIRAFGHGVSVEITGEAALSMARQAEPETLEGKEDPLLGREVIVAPDDYAQVPTRGILVAVTESEWVLAINNLAVETVHVHFPRQGFQLELA